jgi:hypothetical protein
MNKRSYSSLAALLFAALLSSCATTSNGPSFAEAKGTGALTPHNGKSMVLVYRTPGVVGAMNY